jgi:hypothetical protein
MFSVYIMEVNFKKILIFSLCYLLFCFGPHVFAGNSSLRVCGVVPWFGMVSYYTHTHTSYFLNSSLTNNFSLHTWPILKNFLWLEAIDEIELLDAWPLDVGQSGCRCDTPGSSWKPPSSSYDITGCPSFFTLTVLNQLKYLVWGQEPGSLMHTHRRLLTEEPLFSPAYYYTVGTNGNAVQCHIISVVLWLNFLQTSLFIAIHQTSHL